MNVGPLTPVNEFFRPLHGVINVSKNHPHKILFATSIALAVAADTSENLTDQSFIFQAPVGPGGAPKFENVLDLSSKPLVMHAPHIVTGITTQILWFQGSREAVPDVEIWAVDFDTSKGKLADAFGLFRRQSLTQAMAPRQPVLILGNTIQKEPGVPNTYLATVVSLGGWAAASVAQVNMQNGTAVVARKLPLSPFLNPSTLVRNSAIHLGGGDLLVPAYHEMAGAFGLLVRLGQDGRVRSTARIGHWRTAIQPEIVGTGP